MTDELAADSPEQPEGPRRSRIPALLAIAALSLVALVALAVLVVRPSIRQQEVTNERAVDTTGFEWTEWAGAGRYAVIQDFERDGTPLVKSWDPETRRFETKRGYVWLRTEQAAAAVWIVPMSAAEVAASARADGSFPLARRSGADAPVAGLERWVLGEPSASRDATSWAPMANAQGDRVVPVVDEAVGSAPAMLVFEPRGGAPSEVSVDGHTLVPLGWSAAGAYFAALTLDTRSTRAAETSSAVNVYSRDGTLVFTQPAALSIATPAAWLGVANQLATYSRPRAIAAQDVATEARRTIFAVGQGAALPRLLGTSGRGVLVGTEAARGADQYDEVSASGERTRVMLVQEDRSAVWTTESWAEQTGLLRLGAKVSALGEVRTRVLLFVPGRNRPVKVYEGSDRLSAEGMP